MEAAIVLYFLFPRLFCSHSPWRSLPCAVLLLQVSDHDVFWMSSYPTSQFICVFLGKPSSTHPWVLTKVLSHNWSCGSIIHLHTCGFSSGNSLSLQTFYLPLYNPLNLSATDMSACLAFCWDLCDQNSFPKLSKVFLLSQHHWQHQEFFHNIPHTFRATDSLKKSIIKLSFTSCK